MKRLQRPTATYRTDILSVLRPDERRTRRAAIPIAVQQAAQYESSSPNLHGMSSQLPTQPARAFFVKLYKSRRNAVAVLKDRVRSSLGDALAAECQYCSGLAQPSTFDHFVEKAAVPELSLFAPNLIPCCPECNNIRGATFSANGDRRALHFYDDSVDTMPELLVATIALHGGVPSVSFSVTPSPDALGQVYARHFEALNLAERYATKAASQLLLIRMRARTANANQQALHQALTDEAAARNGLFGRNDLFATLFRAIAASPPTLDWAVLP